jgi:hypothetical protein
MGSQLRERALEVPAKGIGAGLVIAAGLAGWEVVNDRPILTKYASSPADASPAPPRSGAGGVGR